MVQLYYCQITAAQYLFFILFVEPGFMNTFYSIILGIPILILLGYFMARLAAKKFVLKKKRSVTDFKQATDEEKKRLYVVWCVSRSLAPQYKRTQEQLDSYARDNKLPTYQDWKEIQGHSRLDLTSRTVYNDWLTFIGAYNPKSESENPEVDK